MAKLKRFYRPDEVAEIFGISQRTVRRLMDCGKIPAARIGAGRRIPGAFIKEKEEEAFNLEDESDDYA